MQPQPMLTHTRSHRWLWSYLSHGKNIVTVQSELEHIRNYLTIMHFRYDGLFDYTIDCSEDLLSCRIPKLTLQPVVENAIYHGIKLRHSKGNIYIVGYTEDEQTGYIEVHDDGPGFSPEQLLSRRIHVCGSLFACVSRKKHKDPIKPQQFSEGILCVRSL